MMFSATVQRQRQPPQLQPQSYEPPHPSSQTWYLCAQVIQQLRKEFDRWGLQGLRIAASDENSVNDALWTWRELGPVARQEVSVGWS